RPGRECALARLRTRRRRPPAGIGRDDFDAPPAIASGPQPATENADPAGAGRNGAAADRLAGIYVDAVRRNAELAEWPGAVATRGVRTPARHQSQPGGGDPAGRLAERASRDQRGVIGGTIPGGSCAEVWSAASRRLAWKPRTMK